ncbi:MAG: T9SS C-terminal target domain-containing protein [Ignavibacteriales bacterium]|jgi:hypothetical protein|nr:MAG: T9SS C-terminal target domain-containing protein [Ignavibacteriales bacterium]
MKLLKIFSVMLTLLTIIHAQEIIYLDDVPEKFKKKYSSEVHEFNPLHIGNVWQYYINNKVVNTYVVGDTVVNGTTYFKKIDWRKESTPGESHFISFERNDTLNGVSYYLDFEDVDEDGDSTNELLMDSLEAGFWSRYKTWKYPYKDWYGGPFIKEALMKDTNYVNIWGDTVLVKRVEYLELFLIETIADRFGIIGVWNESPTYPLIGAIINGKRYGTLTSVEESEDELSKEIELFQNYPNPFNSNTNITYRVAKAGTINLTLYNVLGQKLQIIEDTYRASGVYSVQLNTENYSTGVYYYSLSTSSTTQTKKMILIK